MKLRVTGSSSRGNSYVLEASDGQQLCIETGRPLKEVRKLAGLKTSKCVGAIVSHIHGDHCKYIKDYLSSGIDVYSTMNVADMYLGTIGIGSEQTYQMGGFSVVAIPVEHDIPCYSFLIHHPEMGSLYFFTDCYNIKQAIRGCKYYMCECNYEDGLLQQAVNNGKTIVSQADRIRLSHLSLAHGVEYLQQCNASETARKIILIHGSARHLNPDKAIAKYQQVLGVPTYYAEPGLSLDLI